jgi:hypothetical protein
MNFFFAKSSYRLQRAISKYTSSSRVPECGICLLTVLYSSALQLKGCRFSTSRQLGMSEDIFGSHIWEKGCPNWWAEVKMLLYILKCTGQLQETSSRTGIFWLKMSVVCANEILLQCLIFPQNFPSVVSKLCSCLRLT